MRKTTATGSGSTATSTVLHVAGNATLALGDPVFTLVPKLATDTYETLRSGAALTGDEEAFPTASILGRQTGTVVWDHASTQGFLAFYPTGSEYYVSAVTLTERSQNLYDSSGWTTSAGWTTDGDYYVRTNAGVDSIYGESLTNDCTPSTGAEVEAEVDYAVSFYVAAEPPDECSLVVGFIDPMTGEACGDQVLIAGLAERHSTTGAPESQNVRSCVVSSRISEAKLKITVTKIAPGNAQTVWIDGTSLSVRSVEERAVLESADVRSWRNVALSDTSQDYVGWTSQEVPTVSAKHDDPLRTEPFFVEADLVEGKEYVLEYYVTKNLSGSQGVFVFPFFWEDGVVPEAVAGKILTKSGPVARRCPFDDFHRKLAFKKDFADEGPINESTASVTVGPYDAYSDPVTYTAVAQDQANGSLKGPLLTNTGSGSLGLRKTKTNDVLKIGNLRCTVERVIDDNKAVLREDLEAASDEDVYIVKSEEVFDNLRFPKMTRRLTGTVAFTGENFLYTIPKEETTRLVWATRMIGTGTAFVSEVVPGVVAGTLDARQQNDLIYCRNHNYVVLEVKSDTEMVLALWGHVGYVDPNLSDPPAVSYHGVPKAENGLVAFVEAKRVDLVRDFDDAEWRGEIHCAGFVVIWDHAGSPEDLPGGVREGVYGTLYLMNTDAQVEDYYADVDAVASADLHTDFNPKSLEKLSEELAVGDGVWIETDLCEVFYVGEDYLFDADARAANSDPSVPPKWNDVSVVWPVANINNTPTKMVRFRQVRPRRWMRNTAHPTGSLAKVAVQEGFIESYDAKHPGKGFLASTFKSELTTSGTVSLDHPSLDRWGDMFGVSLAYEDDPDNRDPEFYIFKAGFVHRQF